MIRVVSVSPMCWTALEAEQVWTDEELALFQFDDGLDYTSLHTHRQSHRALGAMHLVGAQEEDVAQRRVSNSLRESVN